jgi:hypothetical protein
VSASESTGSSAFTSRNNYTTNMINNAHIFLRFKKSKLSGDEAALLWFWACHIVQRSGAMDPKYPSFLEGSLAKVDLSPAGNGKNDTEDPKERRPQV